MNTSNRVCPLSLFIVIQKFIILGVSIAYYSATRTIIVGILTL